jgi:hypothetical protein
MGAGSAAKKSETFFTALILPQFLITQYFIWVAA